VIWKQLALSADLEHNVYNVSSGAAYSLDEVLNTLGSLEPGFTVSAQPSDQDVVQVSHEGDRNVLDISRAVNEFGFIPRYDLRQGLASYLAWARKYPALFDLDA
jgi:UDP-glucose 4-epimerase